jgi:WG containing repeat
MKSILSLGIIGCTLLTLLSVGSCSESKGGLKSSSANLQNKNSSPSLDRFLFRRNGKLGYIDRTGKIVVPAKFDRIDENFSEGLAAVSIGNKWGYIDSMGKVVIPLKFDRTLSFDEGLGAVEIREKWGYVNRTGQIVIPAQFKIPGKFENGFASVNIDDGSTWVTIDKTGKVVPAPSPITVKETKQSERDGLISFDQDNKIGYKDRAGKIVVPAKFDVLGFDRGGFNDGLAPVCLKRKCGYIDNTGKIVVPLKFDLVANKFSDGLAWVNIGKKLGYVNRTGKSVIPARYGPASIGKGVCNDARPCLSGTGIYSFPDFDRGLAIVAIPGVKRVGNQKLSGAGYIDTTGKLLFEF